MVLGDHIMLAAGVAGDGDAYDGYGGGGPDVDLGTGGGGSLHLLAFTSHSSSTQATSSPPSVWVARNITS